MGGNGGVVMWVVVDYVFKKNIIKNTVFCLKISGERVLLFSTNGVKTGELKSPPKEYEKKKLE